MMKTFMAIVAMIFMTSCAKWGTLGLKDHRFAEKGDHIIWIQVAGLSPEHFAMLRFIDEEQELAIEDSKCLGSMWSYNLYKIRPSAREGFLGQMLGSQNIKKSCEDIDRLPVWSYFNKAEYETGVIESLTPSLKKGEIDYFFGCKQSARLLEDVWFWKRSPKKGKGFAFHFQDQMMSEKPQVMFDKSCDKRGCVVDFLTHVKNAWSTFTSTKKKTFFVVRDFQYASLLQSGKMAEAKKRLEMLEEIYQYFSSKAKNSNDMTLVLSSTSEVKLDFPKMGRHWAKIHPKGRGFGHRSASLNSHVWATGAGAENFCGVYKESDLLRRFLWTPDKSLLDNFTP